MTGNFEHTKCTGSSAASSRAEASASLVKAEDIITPEELAARLRVPDYWVYERPVTSGFVRMVIASRCIFAVRSNLRDMG